jgi:hypothetical protein
MPEANVSTKSNHTLWGMIFLTVTATIASIALMMEASFFD